MYLLCGYDIRIGDEYQQMFMSVCNDIESLFKRIEICFKYRCLPFVMKHANYNHTRDDLENVYVQIARWTNQPRLVKKMSFFEFCELNQSEIKTKRVSKPAKAVYFILKNIPAIRKYIHMKWE